MGAMSSPIRMDTTLPDPMAMHIPDTTAMAIHTGIMLPINTNGGRGAKETGRVSDHACPATV